MKLLVLVAFLGIAAVSKADTLASCAGEPIKHEHAVKIAKECHLKGPVKGRVAGGKECPATCAEMAMGLVSADLKAVTDEKKIAEGLVKSEIYNQKQAALIAKAFVASGCPKEIEDEKVCEDHVNFQHCFAKAVLKGCGITQQQADKDLDAHLKKSGK